MNKQIKDEELKVVELDGVKYYEKSAKLKMKVSDYGVKVIKGSEIAGYANIPITIKIDDNKDYYMLSGFLNNKLIPSTDMPAIDSYGDVPTGKNVYDLERLINNPVALVDHENSASMIAGNYIYLAETKQGLQFREIMRSLDDVYNDETKDAISAWITGFGKAYSIGGRWYYDMKESKPEDNYFVLVRAVLHEASHVAIGADKWALSVAPDTSMVAEKGEVTECETLDEALAKYMETDDDRYLDMAEKIKNGGKKDV